MENCSKCRHYIWEQSGYCDLLKIKKTYKSWCENFEDCEEEYDEDF